MIDTNIIKDKLKKSFADDIVSSSSFRGEITVIVKKESIVEICKFLRDEKSFRFNFLTDLCGVDKIAVNGTFEIVYHLYSLIRNHRVRIKASVSDVENPSIDSVVSVWPTADWHERETYDMFGVEFKGHPDLRRILTQEGFEGYPLRKDYPVNKRQPENLRDKYRRDFD